MPAMPRLTALSLAVLLAACQPSGAPLEDLRLAHLSPGHSSESQVRQLFGEPDEERRTADGRELIYPLGPEGAVTLALRIDREGRYQGVANLLVPANFQRIRPGMSEPEVIAILGRPGARKHYPLAGDTSLSWRYLDQPNTRMFVVDFGPDGRVLRSGSEDDPRVSGGR